MPTRTDCAALRAQATPWRTPTSSGSSTAAFGSWSTRWLPHMLERWSAQPPPPTHRACHHRLTPPQLAADILVPVALQEAAGPCKGGVMTGGLVAPCARARALFGGRGLSHTVGRERCSRWRRLACGWACAVCHLSCHRVYGVISVRPLVEVRLYLCSMRASYGYLNTMETLETGSRACPLNFFACLCAPLLPWRRRAPPHRARPT